MFIYENRNRTIGNEEMFFPTTSFYHLTGIRTYGSNNELLNSHKFYDLLLAGGIDESKLKVKDKTTYYKLEVLPQLMNLDRMSSMIGNFTGNSLFLQTNKLVGNVNACMGFIKNEQDVYVPNTALQKDIRNIVDDRKNIIAVLKKDINEKMYKNITYLKQNYLIKDLLQNQEINQKVDIYKIYSNEKLINIKIHEFLINIKENNN